MPPGMPLATVAFPQADSLGLEVALLFALRNKHVAFGTPQESEKLVMLVA